MHFLLKLPISNDSVNLIEELVILDDATATIGIELPKGIAIGKVLAIARRFQQLSQEEVGNEIGFSQKKISRIENGEYMDFISIAMLCRFYNISIDELIEEIK